MNTATSNTGRRHFLRGAGGVMMGSALIGSIPFSARAQTPIPGGVLRVSVVDRTLSLNPFVQLNQTGYLLNEMFYMGITRLGDDMQPQGDAVSAWESNADATEFVFTLRQGLRFHDGSPVTVDDLVASILAVQDPGNASPAAAPLSGIAQVQALDARRFSIVLRASDVNLPVTLAHINLRVIPASILRSDPGVLDTQVLGSGPFALQSHEPGQRTIARRFDEYFAPGMPYLDGVEVRLYSDFAAESAALINGEIDIMLRASNADYDRLTAVRHLLGRRQQTGSFMNIVLRVDVEPFRDRRVRQAIQWSIDRQVLQEIVLEGYGRAAYDNVISPEYPYGLPLEPFAPDPQKARALLAEAGFADGIRFTCYASNSPKERAILAVAFKEMLRPVGITVDVQVIPYDEYVANVWRKAACYVALWNMEPTEDSMYTKFMTSDAPYADAGWQNPDFDRLIQEARSDMDEAKRAEKYHAAQRMLMQDVPWLVPFYQDYLSVHHRSVQAYQTHPLSYPHFLEKVWLEESAPARRR